MKTLKILAFLAVIFSGYNCPAQYDSSKKSFFKWDVNYLSNAVYNGRKDSAAVPYLRSSISYNDRSGFYISSGLAVLVNSTDPMRIDMVNIDAGYNFNLGKKVDAGIYGSKFFYSNASYAVESELKGLAGFYLGYNPGIISIGAGGDLLFSTSADISTFLSLSHEFESGTENNKWTITPTIQGNAGTQYFNEAYYEYRKFSFTTSASNSGSGSNNSGKGKGKGHSNSGNSGGNNSNTVKTVTLYDKNRFTLLDVELSLPVNYETKRWGIYLTPTIAIPTSPATFAIDNAIQKENLSTLFFAEVGAFLKF